MSVTAAGKSTETLSQSSKLIILINQSSYTIFSQLMHPLIVIFSGLIILIACFSV